ncbi:c-type cytochrome domain-containing protein, partial [Daejeonella sp.]|uniref:c-type cytochrome domain-containing protein n=1 Tax=Daejeonella sp. TaxID=2805397 RepID=UPI0037C18B77
MKSKLNAYAVSVIFCLNVLIVFLLIFEQQLVIPQWVQPIGRMHPILLHFPIALLILAAGMEFFRFKPENANTSFYQKFTSGFFLSGILFSGITVLMGLILSREDGYDGDALLYHKWFGVSTVFLSSILFKLRDFSWYKEPIAKSGSVSLALILIIAGHFGSVLTHGDNFVLEPITKPELVPLEQAKVYDHVIQPILQEKCVSCHNDQKLKGSLKLTDSLSILKGGKSGKLFIAGKPNLSLLLERIHLPSSQKKHMPPSGKPQL